MKKPIRCVGLLILPPFEQLNLVGPASVFSYARKGGNPAYKIHLLTSGRGRSVRSSTGLTIGPVSQYADFEGQFDTLLVIGGEGAMAPPENGLIGWLLRQSKHTRRIGSICTGAFLLAEAGLLDGRRAVTHWRYCDQFAQQFPSVRVERDPIFIKDGGMYTTAGVSAGADLALALVEEDLGHDAVVEIARELMLFPRRPGGQAQFSDSSVVHKEISDEVFRDLRSWVTANLTADLSVPNLARMTSMTERTFARRFGAVLHMTPAAWIQSLRVEAVRRHLEDDDLSLAEIASRTGFRDVEFLRRIFHAHLSASPAEYQERFRRITVQDAAKAHSRDPKRNRTLG